MASMKVFLDANVLFSASNSGSGIHKLVVHLAKHHKVITSMYAYSEAHRNILAKRMSWLDEFMNLGSQIETVTGMDKEVDIEIAPKDRPILATAIHEKCDFLVTGDKRDFGHLFNVEVRGVQIVTPGTMARIIAND
jgi:predicted nucleic acid-binding protein